MKTPDGYTYANTQSIPLPGGTTLDKSLEAASEALGAAMDSVDKYTGEVDEEEKKAMKKRKSNKIPPEYDARRVHDDDYIDDVLRGVTLKHKGFPDLPDCPTEGLWGSYRKGYEPGQRGGNCKDTDVKGHVEIQRRQHSLSLNNWNKLWHEDLSALKRKRSYAKLTKGLWAGVDPSAYMAYYLPSKADGSLKAFYEVSAFFIRQKICAFKEKFLLGVLQIGRRMISERVSVDIESKIRIPASGKILPRKNTLNCRNFMNAECHVHVMEGGCKPCL